jgi:hypothetical protein
MFCESFKSMLKCEMEVLEFIQIDELSPKERGIKPQTNPFKGISL